MNETVVVDFGRSSADSWLPINDGVMGGRSLSRMKVTAGGTAIFTGSVSLANSGGFASVRTRLKKIDLSDYDGMRIRIRGDGKQYRLRIWSDEQFDAVAYQATFNTKEGVWETASIPFDAFSPTFRGRTPDCARPVDTAAIQQVGLMIADGQKGDFRLEIAWIRAYRAASGGRPRAHPPTP